MQIKFFSFLVSRRRLMERELKKKENSIEAREKQVKLAEEE